MLVGDKNVHVGCTSLLYILVLHFTLAEAVFSREGEEVFRFWWIDLYAVATPTKNLYYTQTASHHSVR